MACGYIGSNNNRLYVARESEYGQVAGVAGRSRFPAVRLAARQELERPERKDKTGSRTYPGTPAGLRRRTTFELKTYMTGWARDGEAPGYGPLFQASLGAAPAYFAGGVAAASGDPKVVVFAAPHGLSEGQALTFGSELRFVRTVVSATAVEVNAPFVTVPAAGAAIGPTVTYLPACGVETVSIFDYWSPAGAVNRILCGAAVDTMQVKVNGDYHEFDFEGMARDLIDTTSFVAGQGGLAAFPEEPAVGAFDYSIIPGHLGQAWLGNTPDRFYTITGAELRVENDLEARSREFGSDSPRCMTAGVRRVLADFELYEMNDAATKGLYQAARQVAPIGVMFQLGGQAGQLFGVYMRSVVPETPEFDDGETRLAWRFKGCRAQGTVNDEISVAFG